MRTLKPMSKRHIVGWIAVSLSLAITCCWAYWGIIENFHEGWSYEALLSNVGLMFAQYVSPMLIFMSVALVSIWWPRIGAGLHGVFGVFVFWFFGGASDTAITLLLIPLLLFALLYWYGRPQPRKIATYLVIDLPLPTLIIFGVGPLMRVAQRVSDGKLDVRVVAGNGVTLTWAPDGPGWPRAGMDWFSANQVCQGLAEDGLTLTTTPQNIWRLPAVDDAVRSMARHGENSGGEWDAAYAKAAYQT